LVWPPIGARAGGFVGGTIGYVIPLYHELMAEQVGPAIYTGYIFPVAMALAFMIRLHGKYWLGFARLGLLLYLPALALSVFNPVGVWASTFAVLVCLSIMFIVQSILLYAKRIWWQLET